MKPLIVLLSTFLITLIILKLFRNSFDYALAGRIAMCAMLLFTAIGHFAFTKGMTMMVPAFIPFKTALVYGTGIIEIAAGICLLIPAYQTVTGWFLIIFFVLLLPANINAAVKQIDYQKGNFEGSGLKYLWFRVPLQILFTVWIYLSAIRF